MAAKLNNANLLFADDFDPEPQRPGYLRIKKMIERPFSHELASKVFSVELRAAAEMLRQVGAGLKTEEDFTVEEQGTLAFARSVLERVQVKDPEFKPKLDQLAIAFPDDANAYRLVNAWNQRRNYRRRQAMEIAKTNESMALYLSLLEADMDEATIFEAFPYLRAEIIELLPKESLERRYVADVKGVRPVRPKQGVDGSGSSRPATGRSRRSIHPSRTHSGASASSLGVPPKPVFTYESSELVKGDCLSVLQSWPEHSIHGVVTDPPYGLVEYDEAQQKKLHDGKGGVWRIPPSFDGHKRAPLPRFTTLSTRELEALSEFFEAWGRALMPALVPGAHVLVASNPLVSFLVSSSLDAAGFERRGEVVRLVQTMRGGDRPKNAHDEFPGVSVMPRSQWEPWVLVRKPLDGRVQDNLRKWKTGGLRRISEKQPFGDVIRSAPTGTKERALADHPSLKPQHFLRQVVRAILPLGEGIVLDPFAGSGSTLAAAVHLGYQAVGIERDQRYLEIARKAIPKLAAYQNGTPPPWET
ncbi:MAG: site-specific DNA-methyltransferase [Gemmatimonadales bacterium]|nr:site-specific DNA-methyltransferase [Gemmatimonadales bacterium]